MKIRKTTVKDIKSIVDIEEQKSHFPLNYNEANVYTQSPTVISVLMEDDEDILGYMFASIQKDRYLIHRLVTVSNTEILIGFLGLLEERMSADRSHIVYTIPESNLEHQLLLKKFGFLATKVINNHFNGEDGYLMEKIYEF